MAPPQDQPDPQEQGDLLDVSVFVRENEDDILDQHTISQGKSQTQPGFEKKDGYLAPYLERISSAQFLVKATKSPTT